MILIRSLLSRSLWSVALLALTLAASTFHLHYLAQLDRDGENSGSEGEILAGLSRVTGGVPLYQDYRQPPHVLAQYTPLYYIIPGSIARCLGTQGAAVFLVGRIYTYLCWLAVGGCLYWLTRQAGAARWASIVAALLWYATELAPNHAVSFRPDAPQLFWSLAAIGLCRSSWGWRSWLGGTGLLVVAFLHKQVAVMPLLALLIAECQARRWTRAGAMAGVWALAVAVAGGLLQWWTAGVFGLNVFNSLSIIAPRGQVELVLMLALTRGWPVWIGAALGFADRSHRAPSFWRWYFVGSLGLALASSAKFGSAQSYYLEPLAAGCVLTGLWVSRQDEQRERWRWAWLTNVLVALTFSPAVLVAATWPAWKESVVNHRAVRAETAADWQRLLHNLEPLTEPVLIEDTYLAARAHWPPYLINASQFSLWQEVGKFDDTNLRRDIVAGHFGAILTTAPVDSTQPGFRHFPQRWLTLIGEHYRLAQTHDGAWGPRVWVYLPVAPACANSQPTISNPTSGR